MLLTASLQKARLTLLSSDTDRSYIKGIQLRQATRLHPIKRGACKGGISLDLLSEAMSAAILGTRQLHALPYSDWTEETCEAARNVYRVIDHILLRLYTGAELRGQFQEHGMITASTAQHLIERSGSLMERSGSLLQAISSGGGQELTKLLRMRKGSSAITDLQPCYVGVWKAGLICVGLPAFLLCETLPQFGVPIW